MAFLKKNSVYKVVNFDSTTDKATWHPSIKENAASPTGYSFGDIDCEPLPENTTFQRRKGFVIPVKCVIVFDGNNKLDAVYSPIDFLKIYYQIPDVGV